MELKDFAEHVDYVIKNIGDKALDDMWELLSSIIEDNKNIFIIGNGGSASIASHFASDLLKNSGYKLKAISLCDNLSLITALSNDDGYNTIFKKQLDILGNSGDLLIIFSCSGISPNILLAKYLAMTKGIKVLFFSGISDDFDIYSTRVMIPSSDFFIIESAFSIICHNIISHLRSSFEDGIPI